MDIGKLQKKLVSFIKKYIYVVLILALGIVLMLMPGRYNEEQSNQEKPAIQKQEEESMNEILAGILSQIEGAGKVQVLLTVAAGEETIYQTDDDVSAEDDASTTHIDTVIITDADRNQTGLIRRVNPPTYLGAIVVCQGADSPRIQLAIVEAVSKVTGLGADRISVLKMK